MRKSNGYWYVRFQVDGKEYSHPTGLEATERNELKARRMEEAFRQKVVEGKSHLLTLQAIPFADAAKSFLEWAEGEYVRRSSYLRIKSSFSYAKHFFARDIVARIDDGRIDDFKTARRNLNVKEVSIRNDLHALSVFWQYAVRKHWARENIIEKVTIPSAKDAVRMNVLSPETERRYFDTCLWMHKAEPFGASPSQNSYADLYDFGRLMIQQGCRPEEVVELRKDDVDLIGGWLHIREGKSKAARRRLKLTAESAQVLASRMGSAGPWVFPSPTGAGKHRRPTWQGAHGAVLEAMGLREDEGFVLYDLRHTFATRLCTQARVDLATAAKIMGHGDLQSIQKYVHPSEESVARAMREYDEKCNTSAVPAANVIHMHPGGKSGDQETGVTEQVA